MLAHEVYCGDTISGVEVVGTKSVTYVINMEDNTVKRVDGPGARYALPGFLLVGCIEFRMADDSAPLVFKWDDMIPGAREAEGPGEGTEASYLVG